MGRSILVTGGSGYFGEVLAAGAVANGDRVRVFDVNRPATSQDMVANQEGNTRACSRRIQPVQAKYRGISILDRNVPALCVQSGLATLCVQRKHRQ